MNHMLEAVQKAVESGASLSCGGVRSSRSGLERGFYVEPTVLEGVKADDAIAQQELFGPITVMIRVKDLSEAISVANHSSFGLTASIHTASLHRAMTFSEQVETGVVVVNGGTHGSEPHMGFGGLKNSGTGWREAGVEALDVYSDWKYINLITDPGKC
jgi:aldehyde dehydrogenase (NAD+)